MANTTKIDFALNQLFDLSPLPDGLNRNEKARFQKGELNVISKIRIYEQFFPKKEIHLIPMVRTAPNHNTFKEPINNNQLST